MKAKVLPVDPAEWVGGCFLAPAYVTGEGPPYRPLSLIWMVPPDGPIVGAETLQSSEQVLEKAGKHFVATTRAPMIGPPRTPARVRVASDELARSIRAQVGSSVEVVIGPTPEVVAVAEMMRSRFEDEVEHEDPSYLGAEGVTVELMAALFEAAGELFRAAPWTVVPDDSSVFLVSAPQLGVEDLVMSVIGQMGESHGFVLFKSLDDLDEFGDAAARAAEGGAPAVPPHFAVNFDRGKDMPLALRREVAKHKWKLAGPNAYPWVVIMDPDLVSRPPTAAEVVVAEALCRGLTKMVTTKHALDRAWKPGLTTETELVVPTFEGPVRLMFRTLQEREGTTMDFDFRAPVAGGEHDEEAIEEYTEALFALFIKSPEARALDDDEDDFDGFTWANMMIGYGIEYCGVTPADMKPSDFEEVLFDIIPRKVSCEAGQAVEIIAELRAFWRFAQREFGLDTAAECLAVLGVGAQKKLESRLASPSNFGLAKSFIMAGKEAGFDVESEEGINAWMKAYNSGLDAGKPPLGFGGPLAARAAAPRVDDVANQRLAEARKKKRKASKASKRRNR